MSAHLAGRGSEEDPDPESLPEGLASVLGRPQTPRGVDHGEDWSGKLLEGRGYMILRNILSKEEAKRCRDAVLRQSEVR